MEVTAYECPYAILGIDKNADRDEIKRAFRELSKMHHPDTGGDSSVYARITWAYTILKDDERRKAHDNNENAMEPTVDQKAYKLIGHIFTEMLNTHEDIIYRDIVEEIDANIKTGISKIKETQRNIKKRLKTLDEIEKRTEADSDVSNVFVSVVREQRMSMEKKKESVNIDLEVYTRAVELLTCFEFVPKSKSFASGSETQSYVIFKR